jgi:hypothetical protein
LQKDEEPEPQLDADLVPVYLGWTQLMDGRSVSHGEGLSWRELSRWCEDHELHGEERRRWCRLLKAMDRAYVALINEERTDGNPGTGSRRTADAARRAGGDAGAGRRQQGGGTDHGGG